MSPSENNIHLLYVPTLTCNLNCNYCYLGAQTTSTQLKEDITRAESTLAHALSKLHAENITAFNLSLHGGEVTTLPPKVLEGLFQQIQQYYLDNFDHINSLGMRKINPHIKTNLYKFNNYYDLFDRYKVSISASIDLPLHLHAKHRVTHLNKDWMSRTISNLKLLAKYPHSKKISATISKEHLECTDEIIQDIWYLHNEIGFDMNQFNIMFAFPSVLNHQKKGPDVLNAASESEQLEFYNKLHQTFKNTELKEGLLRNWFDEFTPNYCTNALNCGEKFYLLQSDGEVYSCVRGQGIPEFNYGNIFKNTFKEIMHTGKNKIQHIHNTYGFNSDCTSCSHLNMCNTGCAVVKYNTELSKSYTCALQKQIYTDFPKSYPCGTSDEQQGYRLFYMQAIHPDKYVTHTQQQIETTPNFVIANDLFDEKNTLLKLIESDTGLKNIFNPVLYTANLAGVDIPVESQLLKRKRTLHVVSRDDVFKLRFHKSTMSDQCDDIIRNTLFLQILRDTPVVYGDEQRTKQEHLFTYQIHTRLLSEHSTQSDYYELDLQPLLAIHANLFQRGVLNNLFITTGYLRDYHYSKQKNNAFYHVQTVNLPFQNVEFYYLDSDV